MPFWMVVKDTQYIAVYYEGEPSGEDAGSAPEEASEEAPKEAVPAEAPDKAPDGSAPVQEDGAYRISFKKTQGESH